MKHCFVALSDDQCRQGTGMDSYSCDVLKYMHTGFGMIQMATDTALMRVRRKVSYPIDIWTSWQSLLLPKDWKCVIFIKWNSLRISCFVIIWDFYASHEVAMAFNVINFNPSFLPSGFKTIYCCNLIYIDDLLTLV